MFGKKVYRYIVDGLTDSKAVLLRKSLSIVSSIRSVAVDVGRGTVEADATRDVEQDVRVACDVAGVKFRTRLRR